MASATDPNGNTTAYSYDTLSRNTAVSLNNTNYRTEYKYDGSNRLSGVWHNVNQVRYGFSYNQFSQRTGVTVGNGANSYNLASYSYNAKGLPDQQTYGTGQTVKTLYDNLDRVIGKQYNGVTANNTVYKADGQAGIYQDYVANTRTRYTYDLSGRLVESKTWSGANADESSAAKRRTAYTYDAQGRLSVTRAENSIGFNRTFIYGSVASGKSDRLEKVHTGGVDIIVYSYDALGRVIGRNIPYGTTAYTYETVSGTRTSPLLKTVNNKGEVLSYEYDNNGNITQISKGGVVQQTYTYDGLNQLVWEYDRARGKAVQHTYDAGGNLMEKWAYNYLDVPGTGWIATAMVKMDYYTYGNSIWKDLLTGYNGQSISYDNIGNPTAYRNNMGMSWTKGKRNNSNLSVPNVSNATIFLVLNIGFVLMKKIRKQVTDIFKVSNWVCLRT